MSKLNSTVEIYVGAPVEYETERIAIRQAYEFLNGNAIPSIIIANSGFTGKQIDLIVATETSIFVIEVKGHTLPLKGGIDGRWKLKTAAGGWKPVPNFYLQTLKAMHALKDSMYSFDKTMISYPVAALVFIPQIPEGSEIAPSDEKVKTVGVDFLSSLSVERQCVCWPLDTWRAFAQFNNLIKIDSLENAFHQNLTNANTLLSDYERRFVDHYGAYVAGFTPDGCKLENEVLASETIVDRLVSETDIVVTGPSGCGKSMLARSLAIAGFQHNKIPIILEAKYFDSRFDELLEDEASLLGMPSFGVLVDACVALNRTLTLVVDGYNECPIVKRPRFMRFLKEALSKYDARVVVVSQQNLDEAVELTLRKVELFEPSLEHKKKIATGASSVSLADNIIELLESVNSGLEANLVGSLNKPELLHKGRFSLFEAYVRKVLGDNQEGIGILSLLAKYFSTNLVFSVSLMEYDRILSEGKFSFLAFDKLLASNLLKKHGDRISFGHELFYNAFVAEAVIRASENRASNIISSIALPRHAEQKKLIIGAIANTSLLYEVLNGLDDSDVIVDCLLGECGDLPREWAKQRYLDILVYIKEEARNVGFEIDLKSWMNIRPNALTLRSWSVQEKAFIDAFPRVLVAGHFLEEFYSIIPIFDESLKKAGIDLYEEAKKLEINNLRSSLFGVGFVWHGSGAIGSICSRLGGLLTFKERKSVVLSDWVEQKQVDFNMSNGQLYAVLKLSRMLSKRHLFSKIICKFLSERWKLIPYHLKMELLDTAQTCWDLQDPEKEELINVLNALQTENIFMSTMILEALKSLGGIDVTGQEQAVHDEINKILESPDNPDSWQAAQRAYTCQFDHLFDHVYWTVIQELPDEEKKIFLTMAVRAKTDFRMFVSLMILDLAEFKDPESGKYIEHWAEVPVELGSMPQDTINVFLVAHIVLGRLSYQIPAKIYQGIDGRDSMAAIGEIFYWLGRVDLELETRKEFCAAAWLLLGRCSTSDAIWALYCCHRSLSTDFSHLMGADASNLSIEDNFPDKFADICRRALEQRETLQYKTMIGTRHEIISFACGALGKYGKKSDLLLLKELVDDPYLGQTTISAIKALQEN